MPFFPGLGSARKPPKNKKEALSAASKGPLFIILILALKPGPAFYTEHMGRLERYLLKKAGRGGELEPHRHDYICEGLATRDLQDPGV